MTLQITDDHYGKAEVPVVRSKAFQPIAEEAHAKPDVMTGMYLLLNNLFMFVFLIISMYFFISIVPCE